MNASAAFDLLKSSGDARAAKIILNHILTTNFPVSNFKLSPLQSFRVWNAARKLRRKVPVAKIIGQREFYGLMFETGRATLDPRPDSETMIDALIKTYPREAKLKILDCGTGTGCLIAAAAQQFPNAVGTAIDISHSAVRCAARNILRLNLFRRIAVKRRDFAHPLPDMFDIIISNPPYIANGDLRVDAGAAHDPAIALYAGRDGLDAYRALAASTPKMLTPDGKVFLEIGKGQKGKVSEIFERAGFRLTDEFRDLSGIIRILVFNKK